MTNTSTLCCTCRVWMRISRNQNISEMIPVVRRGFIQCSSVLLLLFFQCFLQVYCICLSFKALNRRIHPPRGAFLSGSRVEGARIPWFHHKRAAHTSKPVISLHGESFWAIHQIPVYVCGTCLPTSSGFRRHHAEMMEPFLQFAGVLLNLCTKQLRSLIIDLNANHRKFRCLQHPAESLPLSDAFIQSDPDENGSEAVLNQSTDLDLEPSSYNSLIWALLLFFNPLIPLPAWTTSPHPTAYIQFNLLSALSPQHRLSWRLHSPHVNNKSGVHG